jgi:hypothetical protein
MKDKSEFHPGDIHGQLIFNYRHPHIKRNQEAEFMVRAFQRDLEVNGPSVVRLVRTTLAGWKRYKDHPDPRIRRRFAHEVKDMATTFAALVWAAKRYHRHIPALHAKISAILDDLHREFGWRSRVSAALGGPYVKWHMRQEEKRLANGWTYEPPTFYEKNEAGAEADQVGNASACRFVTPAN